MGQLFEGQTTIEGRVPNSTRRIRVVIDPQDLSVRVRGANIVDAAFPQVAIGEDPGDEILVRSSFSLGNVEVAIHRKEGRPWWPSYVLPKLFVALRRVISPVGGGRVYEPGIYVMAQKAGLEDNRELLEIGRMPLAFPATASSVES